jgi:hypothetical protein
VWPVSRTGALDLRRPAPLDFDRRCYSIPRLTSAGDGRPTRRPTYYPSSTQAHDQTFSHVLSHPGRASNLQQRKAEKEDQNQRQNRRPACPTAQLPWIAPRRQPATYVWHAPSPTRLASTTLKPATNKTSAQVSCVVHPVSGLVPSPCVSVHSCSAGLWLRPGMRSGANASFDTPEASL